MAVTIDPRVEARERVGGRYAVRVLEPSPPPVADASWFADDPVNAPVADGMPVVSPVANGDVTWDQLAHDDPELAAWCAERWLGAWRSLTPVRDLEALVRTRNAWHVVAERVMAPARHRANGKIGLRFSRGGFATPWFVDDGTPTQLRVVGTDVVAIRGTEVTTVPLPLLASPTRDVHALLTPKPEEGEGEGEGEEVEDLGYATTTTMSVEGLHQVDRVSAALLADWFGFGCSVLETLRCAQPDAEDTRCQLWPEHFDLSVELGDDAGGHRATFGASPGDDEHPEPYLYVTPWSEGAADSFWNDTAFRGASLPYARLVGTTDARGRALEFLRTGLTIATGRRFAT